MRYLLFLLTLLCSTVQSWAHVGLKYPKGGEVFHPGDVIKISWEILVNHDQKNWDVQFSSDGGTTWSAIEEDLPVTQLELDWFVPNIETSKARIKVIQDNEYGDYTDESGDFVITSGTSEGAKLTVGLSIVDFEPLEPNHESVVSVPLMNTGTSDLMITNISGLSTPFSVSHPNLPFSISSNGSQSIDITFLPTETGSFDQKLTITSNAPDGTIELSTHGESLIPGKADAEVCYAVTGINDGGRLLAVNLSDGSASVVTDMEDVEFSTAVAVDALGYLYVINAEHQELVKVDPQEGKVVIVMDLDLGSIAMDFGSDQLLYIVGKEPSGNQQLFTIDLQSKSMEAIGVIKEHITGVGIDPTSDMLYGIDDVGNLYTIDKNNGTTSLTGAIGIINITDIAFDANGSLYGVAGGGKSPDNELLSIDKTDGSLLATVGKTGFTSISGLTISPENIQLKVLRNAAKSFTVFPNPFSNNLQMNFGSIIPLRVEVYSVEGKLVSTLYPVTSKMVWNGKDNDGRDTPNGLYLVQVETADAIETIKVIIDRR